jgi:hypothetical protein
VKICSSMFDIYILICAFMQIYVVDSTDRGRIDQAKQEFEVIKSKFAMVLYMMCAYAHILLTIIN